MRSITLAALLVLASMALGGEGGGMDRSALPPFVDLVVIDASTNTGREAGVAQLQQIEAQLQQVRSRISALGLEADPINQATVDLLITRARFEMTRPLFEPVGLNSFADIQRVNMEALHHWDIDPSAPTPQWAVVYGQLRQREREINAKRSPLVTCLKDLTTLRDRLMEQLGIGGQK